MSQATSTKAIHCDYGCYLMGCHGIDREDAITELIERASLSESEVEAMTDDEINRRLNDLADEGYAPPHIALKVERHE